MELSNRLRTLSHSLPTSIQMTNGCLLLITNPLCFSSFFCFFSLRSWLLRSFFGGGANCCATCWATSWGLILGFLQQIMVSAFFILCSWTKHRYLKHIYLTDGQVLQTVKSPEKHSFFSMRKLPLTLFNSCSPFHPQLTMCVRERKRKTTKAQRRM